MTQPHSSFRSWVAYVGPFAFPEGGAAARRVLGNAQALVAAGRDVVVVSGVPTQSSSGAKALEPGITSVALNEKDAEHLPNALRYAKYSLIGARTIEWLDAQSRHPEALILYSGYTPYLLRLTKWARQRNIPLIFDAVEWYSAPSLLGFVASPYFWNIEIAMRALVPRVSGVLAISRALEGYYAKRGLPVLRVPPLVDTTVLGLSQVRREENKILRLAYTGTPGKKDLLDDIVKAILSTAEHNERIQFEIAGITHEEFLKLPIIRQHKFASIPPYFTVHGQVSHRRSLQIVSAADFTLFLRRENRVSTCGFPTKFVESLALGTPVITNFTGDLAQHHVHGVTGLLCPTPSASSLEKSLESALQMSNSEMAQMRTTARSYAVENFDFRTKAQDFRTFLSSLLARDTQLRSR